MNAHPAHGPFETITLERQGAVAVLTLDRPRQRNALNARLLAEVGQALDEVEVDDALRAVVVAGAGPSFCAGFDLKEDTDAGRRDAAGWRAVLERDHAFLIRFWEYPKPTVAAVHGHCLAGGFQLALCCDLTVAAEDARFGSPELRFGSVVATLILPWLTGPKIAKEIILCGDDGVTARRAYDAGIANRVVAREHLLAEAVALADRMARLDADAVRGTKLAINRGLQMAGMSDGLRAALELAVSIEVLDTPSRREFRERVARQGLAAALAWRDGRLASDAGGDGA